MNCLDCFGCFNNKDEINEDYNKIPKDKMPQNYINHNIDQDKNNSKNIKKEEIDKVNKEEIEELNQKLNDLQKIHQKKLDELNQTKRILEDKNKE